MKKFFILLFFSLASLFSLSQAATVRANPDTFLDQNGYLNISLDYQGDGNVKGMTLFIDFDPEQLKPVDADASGTVIQGCEPLPNILFGCSHPPATLGRIRMLLLNMQPAPLTDMQSFARLRFQPVGGTQPYSLKVSFDDRPVSIVTQPQGQSYTVSVTTDVNDYDPTTGTLPPLVTKPVVSLSLSPASLAEGAESTLTISTSHVVSEPLKIKLTADPASTAVEGVDYEALPAIVTVPANEQSATHIIKTLKNASSYDDHQLVIKLLADKAYQLTSNTQANLRISNSGQALAAQTKSEVKLRYGEFKELSLSDLVKQGEPPYSFESATKDDALITEVNESNGTLRIQTVATKPASAKDEETTKVVATIKDALGASVKVEVPLKLSEAPKEPKVDITLSPSVVTIAQGATLPEVTVNMQVREADAKVDAVSLNSDYYEFVEDFKVKASSVCPLGKTCQLGRMKAKIGISVPPSVAELAQVSVSYSFAASSGTSTKEASAALRAASPSNPNAPIPFLPLWAILGLSMLLALAAHFLPRNLAFYKQS